MRYFILSFLCAPQVKAGVHYSVNAALRTKPLNANIMGQVAYDGMLWGEYDKSNPMYGYYRAGLRGGGSPTAAAFFQVAPIAPVIFEIQKGTTKRFFTRNSFDCDDNECKGEVDRTDYLVKFAAAYKNFVFLGQGNWRDIETEDGSKPVALEHENFLVSPGTHNYFEATLFGGYKLPENRTAGIMIHSGQISDGHQRMTAAYGVYRFGWNEYLVSAAIGHYKSDYRRMTGASAIFSITRNWGETLSLF